MEQSREPGVAVHVAESSALLVEQLAALLATPPDDPFAEEVVCTPGRGVARWLAQRLSHRLGTGPAGDDGIAARIRFDPPSQLVDEVLAASAGTDRRHEPWRTHRLVAPVLAVLDAGLDQPWLAGVAPYLGRPEDDVRRGRRVALARRLAAALRRYDAQRPAMVLAWACERDEDGSGAPLPDDLAWQAELWRRVRARIGVDSPAQRLPGALDALRRGEVVLDLPPRLSVLAPAGLTTVQRDVLGALGATREVHLWLPVPSVALWRAATERAGIVRRRAELPQIAAHPVLASLARPTAELAVLLRPDAAPQCAVPEGIVPEDIVQRGTARTAGPGWAAGRFSVELDPPTPRPTTVLGALQAAIAADRTGGPRHVAAPDDRTVAVHTCHGRARQVEVLRDVLVGLLADDTTLQPRDVLVSCPDPEGFAPLLDAAFSAPASTDPLREPGAEHPGRRLRVRVADRASAGTNPVLAVLLAVLDLAASRVTASAVLDLAAADPVRRRFGLDDDALERVASWTAESGVRWGEDLGRRERYRVPTAQGTWATGTDRLLLGVAMAEEEQRYLGTVLPLDDVESGELGLVGRWVELLDRLTGLLDELTGVRPASSWLATCERASTLLTDVPAAQRWVRVEALRALGRLREGFGTDDPPLRLADMRGLVAAELDRFAGRAAFGSGAVTVCAPGALRTVGHRVVVLLGMDDDTLRRPAPDGDDVLARDPWVGEPERQAGQLGDLLDAVLGAEQRLVVVCTGADERSGAPRPPAVPVAQLLDALDEAVMFPGHASARDAVVVRQPLSGVDPRVFTPGALGRPGPFGFGRGDLAAARTLVDVAAAGGAPVRAFLDRPLPPPEAVTGRVDGPADVELADLVAVLADPLKAFVRRRLGVVLPREARLPSDRLALRVDGLAEWAAGDRVLRAVLAGADLTAALEAERRRGLLPPGALGSADAARLRRTVEQLLTAASTHLETAEEPEVTTVPLPGGRRLTGAVAVRGDVLLAVGYSRLAPGRRLRSWVELLALTASDARARVRAVTVGRWGRSGPATSVLEAPGPDRSGAVLATLVELHDEMLTAPTTLPAGASFAYAQARHRGQDSTLAWQDVARERDRTAGWTRSEPEVRLVHPHGIGVGELHAGPATPADRRRAPGETTRFGALSVALWSDLLTHEELRR